MGQPQLVGKVHKVMGHFRTWTPLSLAGLRIRQNESQGTPKQLQKNQNRFQMSKSKLNRVLTKMYHQLFFEWVDFDHPRLAALRPREVVVS